LSDVAAQITGSVGLAGSANIGDHGAMFEAIHGSAPRMAGKNTANPSGLLLAAVQMLVHIGQTDMPIEQVRRIAPRLGVGVSTHDLAQLDAALAVRPAYVAFGPVYPTTTKENPDPVVGIDAVRVASARAAAAGVPFVAIGGITRDRLGELAPLVDAVAVVSDLVPTVTGVDVLREVTARARAFQGAWSPGPAAAGAGR